MRILALGDIHGGLPKNFEKIVKNVDYVLCHGDYSSINKGLRKFQIDNFQKIQQALKDGLTWSQAVNSLISKKLAEKIKRKDRENYENYIQILARFYKTKVPIFSVFGNLDDWRDLRKKTRPIDNFNIIHGKSVKINGYNLVGIGDYGNPDYKIDIKKFKKKIENLIEKSTIRTILLSHYPPFGVLDKTNNKNIGDKFIMQLINKFHPLLVLTGHVHESAGIQKIDKSFIINTGEARNSLVILKLNRNSIRFNFQVTTMNL